MIYIKHESLKNNLSNIGLGTLAIGGPNWIWGWGPQDNKDSINAIEKAIDLGINWIDTAAAYGFGHAEEIVGKAIYSYRKELFIATKCGQLWDSDGNIYFQLKADSIRKEIDASLKRLKVEKIDLYQIHWPIPNEDIEEAWNELSELKKEGKVQNIGVSNFNVKQLRRIIKIAPVFSNQVLYNMFDQEIEEEVLPFCNKEDINVMTYSPLASGFLTGKYDKKTIEQLPVNDWRRSERGGHFIEPELSINIDTVKKLKEIAFKLEIKPSQLAIAWILNNKNISAAIVGARSEFQISESIKASSIILEKSILSDIENILNSRISKLKEIGFKFNLIYQ